MSEKRYRLEGDVDSVWRSFTLDRGESRIGSSRSCSVALRVPGVSRHHTLLSIAEDRLWVEDLGSKNKTFVNGEVAAPTLALAPGDDLRCGPVSLTLKEIDAEDAELALVVEEGHDPESPLPADETSLFSVTLAGDSDESVGIELLGAVLGRLTAQPAADLDAAVSLLSGSLGAGGACLAEWPRRRPPIVLAAAGDLAPLPKLEELRQSAPAHLAERVRYRVERSAGRTCAVLESSGADPLGLVLWGDLSRSRVTDLLLGMLLRLLHHFRPRSVEALPAPPAGGEPDLVLPDGIVYCQSPAMVSLYQHMRLLLQGDLPVLILGETGVGKEHLAKTLHVSSPRRSHPFVTINCAAIPAELLEAELFGIGKGVATGVRPRPGKFLEAHDGTLFLDEIGDMAPALQAKLLRVLEENEIQPLGKSPVAVNVRILAATNTDLGQRMADGRFRQDLYYRLVGCELVVPPLRCRRQDLPLLIGHFLRRSCHEAGRSVRGLTVKAMRLFNAYPWPGNVRELRHEIRRLVYLCPPGEAIDSEMIAERILHRVVTAEPAAEEIDPGSLDLGEHVAVLERRLIRRALHESRGNQSQAARLLGLSRNGLTKRMKRYGIGPFESW